METRQIAIESFLNEHEVAELLGISVATVRPLAPTPARTRFPQTGKFSPLSPL